MEIKINDKTITLSDNLTIGQFRKLGGLPNEEDMNDVNKMLGGDWIYNLFEVAGWKDINECEFKDLVTLVQNPKFGTWIANIFDITKKD